MAQAGQAQSHPPQYGDSSPPAPPPARASASASAHARTRALSTASAAASTPTPNPNPDANSHTHQQQQQQQSAQHKRVYQACIPCRRRKVRCDLGSVDNPHDPPCVRCRRESKECYFSATRRKRKAEDDIDGDEDGREDEYIVRNGRKRPHVEGSPAPLDRRFYSDVPLTPGGSMGRPQPLRRPPVGEHTSSDSRSSITASRGRSGTEFPADEPNTPLENYEARTVMRKEVYGPHDALDLLYKAATDKTHETDVHAHDTSPRALGGSLQTPSLNLPRSTDAIMYAQHAAGQRTSMEAPIDPQLTKADSRTEPGPAHADALKAWTRFRFVRAGWFTAQEAIDYID